MGAVCWRMSSCLLLLILLIIDVEVAHLVGGLVRGNDTQKVSQLLGLQVLLAQILQVTLGERRLSSDMDLGLLPVDADLISQVASLSIHLNSFQQELLEILGLNDVVIRRLLAVQGEFQGGLLGLLGSTLPREFKSWVVRFSVTITLWKVGEKHIEIQGNNTHRIHLWHIYLPLP